MPIGALAGFVPPSDTPPGVILAGGLSRRMGGGDKALLRLGSRTLVAHVAARLAPQVGALALNANGPPERFDLPGMPVLADDPPGALGPLAGVLAALDWAAACGEGAVVTVAADTPFFPRDLVSRLRAGTIEAPRSPVLAATSSNGARRRHPVFGLWPVALREDLRRALAGGTRRVADWADAHRAETVDFPDEAAFFNVNTPGDLRVARARGGEDA